MVVGNHENPRWFFSSEQEALDWWNSLDHEAINSSGNFWEHWSEGDFWKEDLNFLLSGFPAPPSTGGGDHWLHELWTNHQWQDILELSDPARKYFAGNRPDRWLEALSQWLDAGRPHNWYKIDTPGSIEAELLWESGYRPNTPEGRVIRDAERKAWRDYQRKRRRAFIAQALSFGLPMVLPFTQPFQWLSAQISALTAKAGFGKTLAGTTKASVLSQGISASATALQQAAYKQVINQFFRTGLDTWIWGQGQANLQRGIFKALTGKSGKPSLSPTVYDIPTYLTQAFQAHQYVQQARSLIEEVGRQELALAFESFKRDSTEAIRLYREYFGLNPTHKLPNWNELVALLVDRNYKGPLLFRTLKYLIQHYDKWVPSYVRWFPKQSAWFARLFTDQQKVGAWNYAAQWSEPLTALYWARKMGYEGDLHWMWDLPFWLAPIPGTRAVKGVRLARKFKSSWMQHARQLFPRAHDTSKRGKALGQAYHDRMERIIKRDMDQGFKAYSPKLKQKGRVKYGRKWGAIPAQPLMQFPEPIDMETFVVESVIKKIKSLRRTRQVDINPHHVDTEYPRGGKQRPFKGRVPWRFRRRRGTQGRFYNRRYRRRR